MRPRGSDALSARGFAPPAYLIAKAAQILLISVIAGGLFWLVWLYASGLRDPRYLDGWILAGGMAAQILFHLALRRGRLSPKSAARWRKVHIFMGYLLIAAFISHSDVSLPDSKYEWFLWIAFVIVTASGLFGTYLAWSLKARRQIDDGVTYDRIPALRADLARAIDAAVAEANPAAATIALPGLPHEAWIKDLYATRLRHFFKHEHHNIAHLIGSQRHLQRLTGEIDKLSRYVDQSSQDKLAVIRQLVIEKDKLDFARVQLGLTRVWLFIHVPVTYSLVVLVVLHVVVVYAFSSGDW